MYVYHLSRVKPALTAQAYEDSCGTSDMPRTTRSLRTGVSMPITEEWRAQVSAARRAAKMKQSDLAKAVGTRQATISRIERGVADSSDLVLAISRTLGIAPPTLATDELERQWMETGRRLRAADDVLYRQALALAEHILATAEKN